MKIDIGLKNHMTKTYGWMMSGVLLTFTIGYLLLKTGLVFDLLINVPYFSIIVLIAQVGVVISLSARLSKIKVGTAKILFFVYSAIMGVSMSVLMLMYSADTMMVAFMAAAILFGLLAIFGSISMLDLTKLGNICMVGILAMFIFSLVGMLLNIGIDSLIYSMISLVLFMGLTAYDAQKCKKLYVMNQDNEAMVEKLSIYSALELYLDFINIFIYILRIIGRND